PLCLPCPSSIFTVACHFTPLSPPLPPVWLCRCLTLIGISYRQKSSQLGQEMGHFHIKMGLTSSLRFRDHHLSLKVSQPTLFMWGGLVFLTNLLKIFSGFIGFFTETR